MVTVKKEQPAKPELGAKKEQVHHKNKFHMPNEELLLDRVPLVVKSHDKFLQKQGRDCDCFKVYSTPSSKI